MNSQIKILLADESAVFLEQLRHVLERDPAFVIAGSANDAQRAVELLHRTQPDILILGLLLPERDGVSVGGKRAAPAADDPGAHRRADGAGRAEAGDARCALCDPKAL